MRRYILVLFRSNENFLIVAAGASCSFVPAWAGEFSISEDGSARYAVGRAQLWDLTYNDGITPVPTTCYILQIGHFPVSFKRINVLDMNLLPELVRFQGLVECDGDPQSVRRDLTIESFSYEDAPIGQESIYRQFLHDVDTHKLIPFLSTLPRVAL